MVALPPLVLGATLAFWGWHTGLWWLGLPLGVLAELPRRVNWRWELAVKERQRVADLCSVLLVLAGVYLYLTHPRLGDAVILLVQWAPVLLFPLLAVQLYGGRQGVELSVLFLSLRGGRPGGDPQVDLRPAYLFVCFLAAAMVRPSSHTMYYPILVVLAGWMLWPLAGRGSSSRRRWVAALALAVGLGFGIGLGLQQAQRGLEDILGDWLARWMDDSTDPFRTTTAIGEVGELKQSEHVVLRVWPDRELSEPLLLRTASYSRYYDGTWLANPSPFAPVSLDASGWSLPGEGVAIRQVSVFLRFDEGRGILPLPTGSLGIQGLEGARLSVSKHRAVKVLEGPTAARYRARYGESPVEDAPEETDLRVASRMRSLLSPLAREWGLEKDSPVEALERLQRRFERDFSYSLRLEAPPGGQGALEYFLLHRRAGHCEYFASAAVLLLRAAGIPARYALGWSVQEYSDLEEAYVARGRHAHAWVLAWVDGAWRDFDPTPPDWGALEAASRPWWGLLQDLWGRLRFLLASDEGQPENEGAYLIWLLLPLVVLLAWRVAHRGRRRVLDRIAGKSRTHSMSPFAPVEAVLSRRGCGRRSGETLREWVVRLQREGEPAAIELTQAVDLYYRQRFDPKGLDESAGKKLESLLAVWMRSRFSPV